MATTPTRQHHSVQRKDPPPPRTRRINSARKRKQNHSPQTAEKGIRRINRAGTTYQCMTTQKPESLPILTRELTKKEKQKQLRISAIQQRRFRKAEANRKVPPSNSESNSPSTPTGNFSGICESNLPEQNIRDRAMNRKIICCLALRNRISIGYVLDIESMTDKDAGKRCFRFRWRLSDRTAESAATSPSETESRVVVLDIESMYRQDAGKNMFSVSLATIGQETKKGGR